jgi:hypothetical protein
MGEGNEVTYTVDESVTYDNLFVNSRLDGEVFETYTKRRQAARKQQKLNAKGKMLWNSREKGTYVQAKHGDL